MRRRTLLCCGLVAALVLAGCSDDGGGGGQEPGPTTTEPPQPIPFALTPLEVELVDAGPEPHAPLVHGFLVPDRWAGHLRFTVRVGDESSLTIEGASRLENQSLDDGTVTAAYALRGLDVTESTDAGRTTTEDALDISGHVVVDDARTAQSATILVQSSGELPGADGLASALDPRLPSILFPFPTEPVGVGAEWDITGPLSLLGNPLDLRARATLTERDGDHFRVAVLLQLDTAENASGGVVDLNGAGDITGVLDQLGPVSGSITLGGTITTPDLPDEPRPLALDLTIRQT